MALTTAVLLVIIIIIIALVFDFTNGFHDSANAIATVVSTKVLSPRKAIVFAAFFNFVAAFGFGVAVASTISKIIKIDYLEAQEFGDIIPHIILGGLIGAIAWNIITWYVGLPTSSSHALIGGIMGSGLSAAGTAAIKFSTVKLVVVFMFLSPLIGLVCGFLFMSIIMWVCHHQTQAKVDRHFKRLQLVSSGAYCFSHGTNDAQKTIGIITPLLFSIGYFQGHGYGDVNPTNLPVPWWVIIAAYTAIAAGTLFGGWRIVNTMGNKITTLRPVHGFAAQTGGAATIIAASLAGIPVSTTHVITASIMGVGATKRVSAVRWAVARSIVWVWILTIPLSALMGFLSFSIIHMFL
jgi:PiT family inorganic phosphate transporter